jgi:dynein heavy chain, axonemal
VDFIRAFPNITKPEVFGLNSNADISKDIGESNLLFDTLLLCGGSGGGGGGNSGKDEVLKQIVESVLHGFPKEFDVIAAAKKYPVLYEDSMNTVLT